ncbi:YceI family protein [Streptosporangium longisporum]|uniref:YceI family protein n=1 Tax=Streptosporangium longisporum TaxID=46187 RepID=A0ABN3YCM3_9ACTN
MTTTLGELTGDYAFDTARTRIGFTARHTIGPVVRGRFERVEGGAHVDGDHPSRSSVTVTIGAGSLQTLNPRRDKALRGKFLDLDDHPAITFTSTGVRQAGETAFLLTGDLTIRGVTRPVTVDVERIGVEQDPRGGARIRFRGGATIDRKDWGVHWAGAAGLVARKVTLEFDVTVIRRT